MMPVYDYRCSACRNRFEQYHIIEERQNGKCPACDCEKTDIIVGGFYSFTRTPGLAPISKMREWDKKAKARGSELVVVGRDEAE